MIGPPAPAADRRATYMSSETRKVSGVEWHEVLIVRTASTTRIFDGRVYEYLDNDWAARGEPWPGATRDEAGRYSSLRCPCGSRVDLPPDTYWREMTGGWLRCECGIFVDRTCGEGDHAGEWTELPDCGWADRWLPNAAAGRVRQWRPTLWLGYKDKEHWVFPWSGVGLDLGRAALADTCRPIRVDEARLLAVHCPRCQGEVAVGGEGFDPPPGYVACDHCSTLICPPDSRLDGWGVGMVELPLA